jgi:UDP-N-acetylglucosamine 1-carboxyvinyltransferase
MDRLFVTGGARLDGAVRISGAKNSALKLMAACLLTEGRSVLRNVPRIQDCFTMGEVLERLGAGVSWEDGGVVVDAGHLSSVEAPYELVRQMRASIVVLGPLLARTGEARVAMPGGDNIGSTSTSKGSGGWAPTSTPSTGSSWRGPAGSPARPSRSTTRAWGPPRT